MLSNQYICLAVAYALFIFGGYLAIFNTAISAYVIGDLSGLGVEVGIAIACGLTGVELWFASWARSFTNWKTLSKTIRKDRITTTAKLLFLSFGLVLVYHFDVESTRLATISQAKNFYFFIWGVAWLVIGPEITMTLGGWLVAQSKRISAKHMKENNNRDADRKFLQTERTKMLDYAEAAGKESAIKKASQRFGPNPQ